MAQWGGDLRTSYQISKINTLTMSLSTTTSLIGLPKEMLRKRFPSERNRKSLSGKPYPIVKEVFQPPNIGYLALTSKVKLSPLPSLLGRDTAYQVSPGGNPSGLTALRGRLLEEVLLFPFPSLVVTLRNAKFFATTSGKGNKTSDAGSLPEFST
nr:hypothetical protein Itr_chr10CG08660 [Ipomoea trifida]